MDAFLLELHFPADVGVSDKEGFGFFGFYIAAAGWGQSKLNMRI